MRIIQYEKLRASSTCAIRKKSVLNIVVRYDVIQATTVKVVLNQLQALSTTMSVELAMSGVSCVLNWHVLSEGQSTTSVDTRVLSVLCVVHCVLNWHVLSEGQVHYQYGHTSLECVVCRVC